MEFQRNDIRNIAFEKINDRFSRGKYLGIEVTIDMTTGYINGPHLVGQVLTKGGKPKQFIHWREISSAREIIEYLTIAMAIVAPILDVTDAPNGLRGAYIHPQSVSHLAQWASPIFAHKVSMILNDLAISEALREKNQLITSLEATVSRIESQNKEQSMQIAELLGYAKRTDETLNIALEVLDDTKTEVEVNNIIVDELVADQARSEAKIDLITEKLEIAVERRSVIA